MLIRIEGSKVTFDNGNSALTGCVQEVTINFLDCAVSLGPLPYVLFWEIFYNLVLLVPVSNTFWVQAIKRVDHLAHRVLVARW